MKANQEQPFRFIYALALLLYVAVSAIVVVHHEPWRDEAQAWLIARDLDIPSLFQQMGYEGTPALWHLILVPFAKSGISYFSMSLVHLILAIISVYIFLNLAPFSIVTKLSFIFSYYMAYEYSVIARNYNISILLLFVIAGIYHKRFDCPLLYSFLIFLLFNTNSLSMCIAFSLVVAFTWERLTTTKHSGMADLSILLMCLGGLVAYWQIKPPPDNTWVGSVNYFAPVIAVKNTVFPFEPKTMVLGYIQAGVGAIVLLVAILPIITRPIPLFILLLSYSGFMYIYTFQFRGSLRHHGFIMIMLFFVLWISRNHEEKNWSHFLAKVGNILNSESWRIYAMLMINVTLIVSVVYAVQMQYRDYKYPYSTAQQMAEYLHRNNLLQYTIAAHRPPYGTAILPYLPGRKFWYPATGETGTFITWNDRYWGNYDLSNSEAIARMEKAFPDRSKVLLLLDIPLNKTESSRFQLVYRTGRTFWYTKETYFLYQYKPAG